MPRTVAIIQARMGSSRLPGKVLLDLAGKPMLTRVVSRVRYSHLIDQVIVAIPEGVQDDELARFCREQGYQVQRGSQNDVLDRFYQAALPAHAGVIVRVTADCPVIDPALMDETILALKENGADLAATRLPPPWKRTYPIGLDVEACTFGALELAWKNADQKFQREHVMPYIYEGVELESAPVAIGVSQRGYKIVQLNHAQNYGELRWTVDTPEDLDLLRQVYSRFGGRDDFSWLEIIKLFEGEPRLAGMNANVAHKTMYDTDTRFSDGDGKPRGKK